MPGLDSFSDLQDETVQLAAETGGLHLDRLIEGIEPHVHRMVIGRLNPRPNQLHAAEEVSQEVLIAVASSLPSLQNRSAAGFRAFLSTIVDHKVIDRIRLQSRPGKRTGAIKSIYSTVAGNSSPARLVALLSQTGATPMTEADRAEEVSRMLSCMEDLKPEYRRVLTYAFFDQLRTAEVAECMGISRAAASMLLLRAVRALRAEMATSPERAEDADDSPEAAAR